jgi:hypothetical protein
MRERGRRVKAREGEGMESEKRVKGKPEGE